MDPEAPTISKEQAIRNDRIKKVVAVVVFIITFIGHVVGIVLGLPMFEHCFNVAVVVMVVGSVLGMVQQVPQFLRDFFQLKPDHLRCVNYFFGFVIFIRIIWLIAATMVIVKAECDNVTAAWVYVYINWGLLGIIVLVYSIVRIVKCLKKDERVRVDGHEH